MNQQAQLSYRDLAMLRVTEYFAKSLNATEMVPSKGLDNRIS